MAKSRWQSVPWPKIIWENIFSISKKATSGDIFPHCAAKIPLKYRIIFFNPSSFNLNVNTWIVSDADALFQLKDNRMWIIGYLPHIFVCSLWKKCLTGEFNCWLERQCIVYVEPETFVIAIAIADTLKHCASELFITIFVFCVSMFMIL